MLEPLSRSDWDFLWKFALNNWIIARKTSDPNVFETPSLDDLPCVNIGLGGEFSEPYHINGSDNPRRIGEDRKNWQPWFALDEDGCPHWLCFYYSKNYEGQGKVEVAFTLDDECISDLHVGEPLHGIRYDYYAFMTKPDPMKNDRDNFLKMVRCIMGMWFGPMRFCSLSDKREILKLLDIQQKCEREIVKMSFDVSVPIPD